MRRRWFYIIPVMIAAIVIPLLLTSCYKNYDLSTLDYDVVVTNYDPNANFPSKSTYSMPDDIILFEDPNYPSAGIDPTIENYILARIRYNMNLLGYTEVADPNPRDIAIVVAASKSDYYYYYSGCWPYYGYDYCWDYPYYGGYYDYAFTAYSLFINMVDSQGQPVPPSGQLSAIWLAGINGAKDNQTASYAKARIEERIDQAFAQSPYLDPTP